MSYKVYSTFAVVKLSSAKRYKRTSLSLSCKANRQLPSSKRQITGLNNRKGRDENANKAAKDAAVASGPGGRATGVQQGGVEPKLSLVAWPNVPGALGLVHCPLVGSIDDRVDEAHPAGRVGLSVARLGHDVAHGDVGDRLGRPRAAGLLVAVAAVHRVATRPAVAVAPEHVERVEYVLAVVGVGKLVVGNLLLPAALAKVGRDGAPRLSLLNGALFVKLYQLGPVAPEAYPAESPLDSRLRPAVQAQVGHVVEAADGAGPHVEVLLQQGGVARLALLEVDLCAGLVPFHRVPALLDLEDVGGPPEQLQALVHPVAARHDPGQHLDVGRSLPQDALARRPCKEVALLVDVAKVAVHHPGAVLVELIDVGDAEAEEAAHAGGPGGKAAGGGLPLLGPSEGKGEKPVGGRLEAAVAGGVARLSHAEAVVRRLVEVAPHPVLVLPPVQVVQGADEKLLAGVPVVRPRCEAREQLLCVHSRA